MQTSSLTTLTVRSQPVLDDITVVIPTLGRDILQESLYRIVNANALPGQIIVVDQGRQKQVASWMETLQRIGVDAAYIPSSERGRAIGINRGLARVKTTYVAITDDDCFVREDWLEKMVERLGRHRGSVITGRVEADGEEDVIVQVTSQETSIQYRPRLTYDSMSGGNMGTSMAVFEQVGYFEEDACMRTAEDGEWAYRALRAQVPIVYAPEVVVAHYGWRDEEQRSRQYRDYAVSHGGFYGKYLRKGDLFIAARATMHHLRALRRWIRGLASGDEETARYGRAYFTGLLPGIINGMRKSSRL